MKISFVFLGLIMVMAFQLTACESQRFESYQTQRVESLGSTLRVAVEDNIIIHAAFFDRFTHRHNTPVVRLGIGQFHSEKGASEFNRPGFFVDAPNLPLFYGIGFFRDFTVDQDRFLSIQLSSDHDFTVYNNGSSPYLDLIVPNFYVCDNFIQGVELAIYPNDKITRVDGQFHHTAQISIPILISQGLISKQQKPLCIRTRYAYSEPAWGGDYYIWYFNDIRIEPYEIEAVMADLKAQGIEYVYPADPIYPGSE